MTDPVKHALVAGSSGLRAFGGSTVAAVLRAAAEEAAPDHRPHAVQAHFLAPADHAAELSTSTRVLRRTATFTTVGVDLAQQDVLVAHGSASFHHDRATPRHAASAPVPSRSAEGSPPASGGPIPPQDAPSRRGYDLRAAEPSPVVGADGRPVLRYWVRSRADVQTDLDQAAALAWVSDLCMTRVADLEHEGSPGVRVAASLDHAVWFHRRFDLTDWLLYEVTSPAYEGGIAFSTGRLHADGVLVASVAQQSTLRRVTPT